LIVPVRKSIYQAATGGQQSGNLHVDCIVAEDVDPGQVRSRGQRPRLLAFVVSIF
jgi:hypothetical protein